MQIVVTNIRRRFKMARFRTIVLYILGAFLTLPLLFSPAQSLAVSAVYEQVPAVIDVRTTFSDGAYDPVTLVEMAKKRGIGVVCLNDHDTLEMEYGIPPFRNVVKKRVQLRALNITGAENYLAAIADVRSKYPDMVVISGAEHVPFYYWTGSLPTGDLTAHDHERRILTFGMEKAEDFQALRLQRVTGFAVFKTLPAAVAAVVFIFSLFLLPGRGAARWTGALLAVGTLLFLVNAFLEVKAPFNSYQGAQGAAPYQQFIDAANNKRVLTFWNYPETKSGVRKMGPIHVSTPPYPQMLLETTNYTGFTAIYGDNITVTEPGGLWDRALEEYCRGYRWRAPWGIATADYHEEGESGQKLGDFQTVLLLSGRSSRDVLDAMAKGRMYACRGNYPQMPRLTEFTISPSAGDDGRRAVSGETTILRHNPRIRISIAGISPGETAPLKVRLIRSGELVRIFSGPMPLSIDYVDYLEAPGKKIYYRIDVSGYGTIVSNPIFVEFSR